MSVSIGNRPNVGARALSMWDALCPVEDWPHPANVKLEAVLDDIGVATLLDRAWMDRTYPEAVIAQLRDADLASFFVDDDGDWGRVTGYHLTSLVNALARRDGGLAITVGVNALALLPAYVAASEQQLHRVRDRVRDGAFAALLLTEMNYGSDLTRNETYAEAGEVVDGVFVPTHDGDSSHVRVVGEKHLINGGTKHDLLFVLARTRPPRDGATFATLRDFSVVLIDRAENPVEVLSRWDTVPAPAADISGVRLPGTVVPRNSLIGGEGAGLEIVLAALGFARGGVSGLAAGAAAGALDVVNEYIQTREIYGDALVRLDAIAEHAMKVEALALLAAAPSVRAAATTNFLGRGASYYAAVAKFASCMLAEEAVTEGRRILSARALVHGYGYDTFVRDVPLYTVFDGTPHVVLDQLAPMLQRMVRSPASEDDSVARMREIYRAPPRPIIEFARARSRPILINTADHLRRLAEVARLDLTMFVALADSLFATVAAMDSKGAWTDGALRFEATAALAMLEAVVSVIELADEGVRASFGLPLARYDRRRLALVYRFAACLLGSRVAQEVNVLVAALADRASAPLQLELELLSELDVARREFHQIMQSERERVRQGDS
jgi:alkylation response protein AidB-like acyl-CoA dehydrogenase